MDIKKTIKEAEIKVKLCDNSKFKKSLLKNIKEKQNNDIKK